jgi:hypothetical protein
MSLVYPAADPNATDPRIHALVVGVSEYPHLIGGTGPLARYPLGLKQLSSPSISAQAIANWLIPKLTTTHANPDAPLGTVELLLSPGTYTDWQGNAQIVELAEFDRIKKAFERWLKRCDAHADNIALFYCCGHGFEWPKTYLLARDYGESFGSPFENMIDFTVSRSGFLADCKATTLCCFLDACREVNTDLIQNLNIDARPLWNASGFPTGDRAAPRYLATRQGEQAHGPAGGVSYFAEALIRCWEVLGAGMTHAGGSRWRVDTDSLGVALRQVMARTKIPQGGFGACQVVSDTSTPAPPVLHELPTAHTLAEIGYQPLVALDYCTLSYVRTGSGNPSNTRGPSPNPWQIEVEAGDYDIGATFAGGQYPDRSPKSYPIHPPFVSFKL